MADLIKSSKGPIWLRTNCFKGFKSLIISKAFKGFKSLIISKALKGFKSSFEFQVDGC
jgi:hypothetical protein